MSEIEEALPIEIDKISKKLWPRKFYVKLKEYHPVLGTTFLIIWSIFWFTIAVLINVLALFIIIATIVMLITAISQDSSNDFFWISHHRHNDDRSDKKGAEPKKEDESRPGLERHISGEI